MRPALYIIAILCWILQSCDANSTDNAGKGETDSAATERTYILQPWKDTINHIYAWQGNLDGKYPVLMWYKEFGDVVKGSLFYTENKNPRPINLLGTIQDNQYRILEIWPDGDISGIWEFEPDAHAAEGRWTSPTGDETYSTSLMRTDTAVTVPDINTKAGISGTYAYSYGTTGAQGHMTVIKKAEHIVVSFDNVSAAPARNLAILDATELPLVGNEAIYRSERFGPCAIRIRFYQGFAVVDYVDGKMDCGFGNSATAAGVYVKLN